MRSILEKSRATFVAGVVAAALAGSVPTHAQVAARDRAREQVCSDPSQSVELFAEQIGPNRIGYGTTPGSASIPGPTLEMTEGECLAVTLVNDTERRLSMHAHGVSYTTASDGTPLNKSCVGPGRSRTYFFEARLPQTRPDGTTDGGSAGYWHYHDHCLGTEHGTRGIYSGLFGALIVRRPGDPVPDRKPCVLVMIDTTFNLKRAPRTPKCASNLGQRVEFVIIGHGDLMHTFHLHGHRWSDNRTGISSGLNDPAPVIDNRTVGPADSFGFQVIAGEGVGEGPWMYHCHVQGHSDAGMEGVFVVRTEGGQVTNETRELLRRWRRAHHGRHTQHE